LTGITETFSCNHRRATIFPIADPSIFNTCQQIAYKCDSYEEFLNGECADCGSDGEKCKPFPLQLDFWDISYNNIVGKTQSAKRFFLKTSDMLPFCLYHYQVVVKSFLYVVFDFFCVIVLTFDRNIEIIQ